MYWYIFMNIEQSETIKRSSPMFERSHALRRMRVENDYMYSIF
jgi:hypothetical protein